MATFHKVKFGDLIEQKIKVEIKKGLEYSFVPMENIEPGLKYPRIMETKVFNGSGSKFADGDTLFARITPCLQNKKIAKVKNLDNGVGFGSTEFFILRAKKDRANPDYLHYVARLDDLIDTAISSMVGASGRQRADIKSIYEFEVNVPDLPIQNRIASVLSTYDDLIENNEKRIKALEEIASRLYTEWFVKFKFPGHEKVQMVDSGTEFGMIPKGWEVKKLKDVADILFGYNFKSNLFNEEGEGVQVVRIRDVLSGDTETFTPQIVDKKYLIKKGDLLIGMDGIFHMSMWFTDGCFLNQRVVRIRSEKLASSLIFESVKKQLYFFQKTIVGATVGHLSNGNIRDFKILVPNTKSVLNSFQEITDLVINLKLRNKNLSLTRDLLIPQLVTGKREVK